MRVLPLLMLVSCTALEGAPDEAPDKAQGGATTEAIERVLDAWHQAAADVDFEGYMSHFAPDAVFLGTDGTERWAVDPEGTRFNDDEEVTFYEYVHYYFVTQGRGWRCVPRERHVALSPDGKLAWFDEELDHASYGEMRGTGVLRWAGGEWKIAQYNMTLTVPNAVAGEVTDRIKAWEAARGDG